MDIQLVDREISIILDSNEDTGAINKSADGSGFTVQFEEPLLIPSNAVNPILDVEESAIWYSTPNIFDSGAKQNNAFRLIDLSGPTNYDLFIPGGLYSIIDIQNAMNVLVNSIAGGDIIELTLNDATGRVELFINTAGYELSFNVPNTLGTILGFLPQNYSALVLYTGQLIPQINAVNYYLVQTDLVDDGIRFNNAYNSIIESVLIDVAPRELIITRPFNPPTIPIDTLSGNPRSRVRVQLLTDKLEPADTDGENFYVRLSLRWKEPITLKA
jgi:hypothetical protein